MPVWSFDPAVLDKQYFKSKYDGTMMLVNGSPVLCSCGDSSVAFGDMCFDYYEDVPSDVVISPFLPDSQWVQDTYATKLPVYMRRVPARQWHRSMHGEQYQFSYPYLHGWSPKQRPQLARNVTFARNIVAQKDITLAEGIKLLSDRSSWGGCVLTKDFALVRAGEKTHNIYNSVGVVGIVALPMKKVLVAEEMAQELLDYFTNTGETKWDLQLTTCL